MWDINHDMSLDPFHSIIAYVNGFWYISLEPQ